MSAMASQITSFTIVHSTVYSRRRSKKTSTLRVTGLCKGNSPMTGEFPAQRSSNEENVSNWCSHHEFTAPAESPDIHRDNSYTHSQWFFLWAFPVKFPWVDVRSPKCCLYWLNIITTNLPATISEIMHGLCDRSWLINVRSLLEKAIYSSLITTQWQLFIIIAMCT